MTEVSLSKRILAVLWTGAILAALISLLGTRLANADSLEHALAAYSEGRFIEAAETAKTLGDSSSYALAAKSMVIHARYITADPEKKTVARTGDRTCAKSY